MFINQTAQNNQEFLPVGDILCPRGGCRVLDPNNFDGSSDSIVSIIVNVASIGTFIIGALSILFFIYAAFLFLLGGEKGGERGRKVMFNTVFAVVIAALSFTAIQFLNNFLNTFRL